MADNEIVEFTGEETSVNNIGKPPNIPDDNPQTIKSQSWENNYVDPTRQPVHVLLHDGYYGVGGFKGDIDPDRDVSDGTYSYQTPLGAHELQYGNRVKRTFLYNYFQRFINAKVKPVFSQGNIATITMLGETVIGNDDLMQRFIKDCTGTGTTYDTMQEYYLTELQVHDVVYHVMTKMENRDIPSLSEYRAIDVIYATPDEYGLLEEIFFYNGTTYVQDGDSNNPKEVTKAIKFYMENGFCWIQHYVADKMYSVGNWTGKEEWKENGEPKNTGVDEMVVYAQLTQAMPNGEFLPENPRSMGLMNAQLGLYQDEGCYNWLYSIGMIPTFYIYGDMTGLNMGAGQGLAIPIQSNGSQLPAPDYVTVDSSLLTAGMEKVQFNLDRLREIAKENGVDTTTGSQAQSAESKRFEFQATEQELRRSVDMLQTADEWIFNMFNKYTGRTDAYTYKRTYPVSFYPDEEATLEDMLSGIEAMGQAGLTVARNTVIEAYLGKLIGRGLSEDKLNEILAEIDSANIEVAG